MPDRSRQKERKRLKRKRKQEAHRKAVSISPFKAISRLPAEIQCWMNTNWKMTRQASILVLRRTRSGRCAMANFLVDFGVAGLKDAYGRLDFTEAEFVDKVLGPFEGRFPMASVEPSEAGKYIAGAIRFAHDNGFRLPHRFDRWVAILGDIGDWRNAEVSDFEMEFAGSLEDLRHRLIGQSVDEFLRRKDVSIVLSDSAPSLLSDDIIDFEDADDELRKRAVACVRQWLTASNRQTSPMLETAWDIYAEAIATSADEVDDSEDSAVEAAYRMEATIQDLIALEPSSDRTELSIALAEIVQYAVENQDSMADLLSAEDD
jgi:hypothetical protein